eukprot:3709556-Lingulodinium_polyedra.AAC.1
MRQRVRRFGRNHCSHQEDTDHPATVRAPCGKSRCSSASRPKLSSGGCAPGLPPGCPLPLPKRSSLNRKT